MTEIEELWSEIQPEDLLFDEGAVKLGVYADGNGYVIVLQKFRGEDAAICLPHSLAQEFLLCFAAALFKATATHNRILEIERAEARDNECAINRCAHCFRAPPKVIR